MNEEERFLSDLEISLRLRNDDAFLYEYVLLLAKEMFEGDLEEYDNDFESFDEAIEEAIGITIYPMLDTEELEEEEFSKEFFKIKKRLMKVSKARGIL